MIGGSQIGATTSPRQSGTDCDRHRRFVGRLLFTTFIAALLCFGVAKAEDQPGAGTEESNPAASCPPYPTDAAVTKAYRVSRPNKKGTSEVRLGDEIQVKVKGLAALQKCATEQNPIVLFLGGRPLPDHVAFPPTDPSSGILHFKLRIDEDSREAWKAMLGSPTFGELKVTASVGLKNAFPISADPAETTLNLDQVPGWWLFLSVIILAIASFVFFRLALRTNLLRDGRSDLAARDSKGRYSLAKTQVAWWFFFIVAAYLFIFIVTGDYSGSINTTALALLGIGAGTAMISATIDSSKNTPPTKTAEKAALAKAEQEKASLTADIAALDQKLTDTVEKIKAIQKLESDISLARKATPSSADLVAQLENDIKVASVDFVPSDEVRLAQELADKEARLAAVQSESRKLIGESEGFLIDIISDANGVSFHRYQIVIWTVVLGFVFVHGVYVNLAMPLFNAELLGLLGLSAATYLGLKTQEPVVPTL